MKSSFLYATLTLFSLLFFSCSDSTEDNFNIIQTPSPFDFHAITSYQGKFYATGGDVWNKSNLLTSSDGFNWTLDSLTNKSIFDLYADEFTLYGVGNDGYIFSGTPELKLSRTKYWGLLRAFTSSGDTFVAVGGKDFNKGWIYQINSDLKVDTAYEFQHEILDVICDNKGNCAACGFGLIVKSNDSGKSWERVDETGDYYNSIARNNEGHLFIVGYSGTIIKSTNLGTSWEKLKNGHSPLSNNNPFRTIKFFENRGFITGDNGLIWTTTNGGDDWENISIDTDYDIFDFELFQNTLICLSEQGKIIEVNL